MNNNESGKSDVADDLAQYASTVTLNNVPDSVIERAKLVLLDTIGVCLRGSQTDYVREVVINAEILDCAEPTGDGATTFATLDRRPPSTAAFANATGGTTLELDEGNQRSAHMGIHIVPPAIAFAEHQGASGRDVVRALIAAYEASARIGDAIRPQKDGLHPHGTWSPIGAAIATGLLCDFDRETMAEAVRIAVNPFVASHWASALEGETVRNFYTGTACRHGIQSAILAKSGVTGVDGAIERCLFPYVAGEDNALETLVAVIETLDDEYYLESSYFKMHACCRYAHAPIEAFEQLLATNDLDPDSIERIRVSTFSSGCLLDSDVPETILKAKFSTPYALASLAILGTTGIDAYKKEHLQNERIQRLTKTVKIREDPEYSRRAQEGHWGAAITVETTDGRTVQENVLDARGGGDNPFSPAEVREKFRTLVNGTETVIDAKQLEDRILNMDQVFDELSLFDDLAD